MSSVILTSLLVTFGFVFIGDQITKKNKYLPALPSSTGPGIGLAFVLICLGFLSLFRFPINFIAHLLTLLGVLKVCTLLVKRNSNSFGKKINIFNMFSKKSYSNLIQILIVVFNFFNGALSKTYNSHDDFQGYFVFAAKILSLGEIGEDPFSERRLVTSLGGQSYLDAIVLSYSEFGNLFLADAGIGYLLFAISVKRFLVENEISELKSILIIAFASFYPIQVANITSTYTSVLLIFSLYIIYSLKITVKSSLFFGILTAGALLLKNSLLGLLLIFFALYFARNFQESKNKLSAIYQQITLIFLVLLAILPYSLSLKESNGTYIFPLTGLGFHGSQYGNFNYLESFKFNPNFFYRFLEDLLTSSVFYLFIFLMIYFYKLKKNYSTFFDFLILLLLPITWMAIYFSTNGYGLIRYIIPFTFPIFIYLLIKYVSVQIRFLYLLIVVLLIFLIPYGYSRVSNEIPQDNYSRFVLKNSDNSFVSKNELSRIQKMQSLVPPNEKILVRLHRNYLFDFSRNKIYIADYPGASSPPPGMPMFQGPDKLREYLLKQNINYVALRYSDLFLYWDWGYRLDSDQPEWIRVEAKNAFDFQDNVYRLAQSCNKIYDDGDQYLIDLRSGCSKS